MKEVSTKIFNRLCRQEIDIERCECGYCPEVVVIYPWYGSMGAKVKCRHCGDETKLHHIAMCFVEAKSGRLGSPVTQRSMMRGIMAAIEDWNRRMKAGRY